jgi:hypothetical protein
MDAFLSKPLTVDELRAAVVKWLSEGSEEATREQLVEA